MPGRENLHNLIINFSIENLNHFFQNINEKYRPDREDYSDYLNEDETNFNNLIKLGEIEFDVTKRLIVCACESVKELTTRSGKKRQYEIARKILKDETYDAGIFTFYDEDGHFRFSLVVTLYSGVTRKFTNYKRYTYFVSPDLANKTFLNQIGKANFSSINKIQEAFSIEAVSNEFYNEFKPKFDQIANKVVGIDDSELKQDFALLFVIRIIFLGFVQKKGWLGDSGKFIQNFWNEYKDNFNNENIFYIDWLTPLFFEALSTAPGHKVKYQNNDFSVETENILQMAPYLNGELFKEKKDVDDLSIWIPDSQIDDFFDFLFQYNFTIEENILYDEELELNPEFLGIIFERLVNKADGAVYTPRIEVDFMCRIALVKWLEKNCSADLEDLYCLFFREGGAGEDYEDQQKQGDFSTGQIREMVGLLESVTVCDPAAGSGAFEVGMMHVLFEILDNLYTRNNAPNDLKKKSRFERKKDIIASSLYGVEVKRWAVWINQLRLWLTLFIDMPDEEKNSLAPLLPSLNFKIRRGDSLVQRIGTKMFPVQDHANLPSDLKRKITELKKLKVEFFHNRGKNSEFIRQQENLIFRKILDTEIKQKQDKLKSEISIKDQIDAFGEVDKKKQKILAVFEKEKEHLQGEIAELEEQKRNLKDEHPLIWNIEFSEIFFEKGGFDIIIGNPPYVRQEEIADPENKLEPKKYKSALQEMVRMDYPNHFIKEQKIDSKSDLYTYFYIRSLHLLNKKGVHVFICSNSWLDVGYGTWMQYFLLKNIPIHFIVDNHAKRSFASSEINTIITVLDAQNQTKEELLIKFIAFKKSFEETIVTENLLEIEQTDNIAKNDSFRIFPITHSNLQKEGMEFEDEEKEKLGIGKYTGDKWGGKYLRAPDIFFTILEKNKNKLIKLKKVAKVQRGITTGCNEFFYLDKLTKERWKIEKEYTVPAILKTDELKYINITKHSSKGYFFWCNKNKTSIKNTNALKYINWGEKQSIIVKQGKNKGKTIKGYHNIETVKNRKRWYDIAKRDVAPVWWIIAHNERSISFLNNQYIPGDNFFELRPKSYSYESFVLILSSTYICLMRELFGRTNFGGGVLKTQKPDLEKFPLILEKDIKINYKDFEKFMERKTNSIFQECGIEPEAEIPISKQEPKPLLDRAELDKIIFDALDLTEDERKEVYRAVCQLVWNRLSKAQSL